MNISSNLYPIQTNYGLGLIGFTTFEEAQQYATKHSMELVGFTKKRNAKFWEEGDEACGPYDLTHFYTNWDLYSRYFSAADFWAFVEDTLAELSEDDEWTTARIEEWLEAQKGIKAQMDQMSDDEFAIVWANGTCEILPKLAMSWHDYINDISYEVGCFQPYKIQD